MPDINEKAETQQEYFGKAKLETDYKDLSMRLYKRIANLEKENAELEEQIENMKCCGNCEHATHDNMNGTFCNYYSEWEHADLKCTQWELGR